MKGLEKIRKGQIQKYRMHSYSKTKAIRLFEFVKISKRFQKILNIAPEKKEKQRKVFKYCKYH